MANNIVNSKRVKGDANDVAIAIGVEADESDYLVEVHPKRRQRVV